MRKLSIGLNLILPYSLQKSFTSASKPSSLNRLNNGCPGVYGKRECTRRRKQIAEGRLKVENGLVR